MNDVVEAARPAQTGAKTVQEYIDELPAWSDGTRLKSSPMTTMHWASGDQLPHVVAPTSGHLINANERVAPPDFPVFMGRDWFGDWRARRIRELLDRKSVV